MRGGGRRKERSCVDTVEEFLFNFSVRRFIFIVVRRISIRDRFSIRDRSLGD